MKNGFTLTELLAVLVLLSILMIIAIPTYNKITNDIKKANLESTITMLENTMLNYANKYLIDDIKPAGNNCLNGNCCKYYSVSYIKNNNIFEGSITNPVTNQELTGYIKLSYDISSYILNSEYQENSDSHGNCEVKA